MRDRLKKWALSWFVQIFVAERGERFVGACHCRGMIYVVTDCRILRYDPERDQVSMEAHTR